MSEIKCPACKATLTEPLPERCPVCNLEGLNRMFLTLEDYEEWKTNVLEEHMKKLCNYKFFAGVTQFLVLLDNGTLFQIVDSKPVKVAEKVTSVAAGYNYSLYLDVAGKVHFIGNSGIAFRERFNQSNLIFKKVFARRDSDIFGAEDIDGNFYVWGENCNGHVFKSISKKFLFTLNTVSSEITNKTELNLSTYGTYGSEWIVRWYSNSEDYSPSFCELESSIKTTAEYDKFRKIYGEENLKIEFNVLSKGTILESGKDKDYEKESTNDKYYDDRLPSEDHGPYQGKKTYYAWKKMRVSLRPDLYLINNYIFIPMQFYSKTWDNLFYKKDQWTYREYLGSYWDWYNPGGDQEECYHEFPIWADISIEENDLLKIDKMEKGGRQIYYIKNVKICFISDKTAYVVESSGRVLKGDVKYLLEGDLKSFDEVVFSFRD